MVSSQPGLVRLLDDTPKMSGRFSLSPFEHLTKHNDAQGMPILIEPDAHGYASPCSCFRLARSIRKDVSNSCWKVEPPLGLLPPVGNMMLVDLKTSVSSASAQGLQSPWLVGVIHHKLHLTWLQTPSCLQISTQSLKKHGPSPAKRYCYWPSFLCGNKSHSKYSGWFLICWDSEHSQQIGCYMVLLYSYYCNW